MIKPNLFFDFDGFLFNTAPATAAFLNEQYGISIRPTDLANMGNHLEILVNKHLNGKGPISRDAIYNDYGLHFIPSLKWHEFVEPFEDMCSIVPKLSKKYYLWTVTARQKHGMPVITHLLEKFIPSCMKDIHCVWENLGNGECREILSKRDFIKSIPGEHVAFFDDTPQEIERMHDLLPSYLFDPWHLHDDMTHIQYRVHGFKEIGEIFL